MSESAHAKKPPTPLPGPGQTAAGHHPQLIKERKSMILGRRRFVISATSGLLVPALGIRPAKAPPSHDDWGPAVPDDRPIGGGTEPDPYPWSEEDGLLDIVGKAVIAAVAYVDSYLNSWPGVATAMVFGGSVFVNELMEFYEGNNTPPPYDWDQELRDFENMLKTMPPDLQQMFRGLGGEEALLQQPISIAGVSITEENFRSTSYRMFNGGALSSKEQLLTKRFAVTSWSSLASCCFTTNNNTKILGRRPVCNNGLGNTVRRLAMSPRQKAAVGSYIRNVKTNYRESTIYKPLTEICAAWNYVTYSKAKEFVYPALNQAHTFYTNNLTQTKSQTSFTQSEYNPATGKIA
jgi:hypothetical protein